MAYDFKKAEKQYYQPKDTPVIITIPKMHFLAITGKGNPNEEGGEYQTALGKLYGVAYTLRMSYKQGYDIPGYEEYVVPPLEGLWWMNDICGIDYGNKDQFHWISLLRLPDFIREEDITWAIEQTAKKKKIDCEAVYHFIYDEGLCVQCMHLGAFDDEPATVMKMNQYLAEHGYEEDIQEERYHHELYLSGKSFDPVKMRTVIRHPIKKSK